MEALTIIEAIALNWDTGQCNSESAFDTGIDGRPVIHLHLDQNDSSSIGHLGGGFWAASGLAMMQQCAAKLGV
jgi:hypothetical protein